MACSVSDEIQSRFTGALQPAFCITQRWMTSPSCPASPQLITSSQRAIRPLSISNWFMLPFSGMSLSLNVAGIMGKSSMRHCFHCGV